MKKIKFNLQLFAEGGAGGAGASAGTSAEGDQGGAANALNVDVANPQSEDLSKVIYGKSTNGEAQPNEGNTTTDPEGTPTFKELIKKGGLYHEEFNQITQDIINKRFKESKKNESVIASHQPIMNLLAMKYGVDANDTEALLKAMNTDDSLFQAEAFEKGLSAEQYRNMLILENENRMLKQAREDAEARQNSEKIYADWLRQADEFASKYNLEDFDMAVECENEDFVRLLSNGIQLESAYIAVHPDRVLTGAMVATAKDVQQKLANNIASRHTRPSENGVSSSSSSIMKSDPSKLTDADMDEVLRRIASGERISF